VGCQNAPDAYEKISYVLSALVPTTGLINVGPKLDATIASASTTTTIEKKEMLLSTIYLENLVKELGFVCQHLVTLHLLQNDV